VLDTPCVESRTLSQIAGCQVFLKFENLQFTASFKERGACNKLAQLSQEERARFSARLKAERAAAEAERQAGYEKAALEVRAYWQGVPAATGTEYSWTSPRGVEG